MTAAELPTGLVTFFFSDIEGSTRLSAAAGEQFATLIDRHHAIVREALAAHAGVEVSTEGDAFFAVFEVPAQAVAAASRIQRDLADEPWPDGLDVRDRIGLHTGNAELGGDSYAGYDVNKAARISASAHGGQVVMSSATWDLVAALLPDGVTGRPLGEHRLKDIDEAVMIHQLVDERLPQEFPPLSAERPGNLPSAATTFIGRQDEIDAIVLALGVSRIVTLTGPGGSGKTRLTLEAARVVGDQSLGGTWFVSLEAIRDAEFVLPAIASVLGVKDQAGQPLADTLAAALGGSDDLLVLDNMEQVISAGPQIAALVSATPAVRVLVSSREAMRVAGEQEMPVSALSTEAAVSLFEARAKLVRPNFAMDDETREAIERIVARLDHLPLAIELAAARTRMFAPDALLGRLDDRLGMLASSARDVSDRQRSLRGAIEWSYNLLDEQERATFVGVSVFEGGMDLGSAELVLDAADPGGPPVLGLLESLIDKSLLAVAEAEGAEPRLQMLETIHAFATTESDADVARQTRLEEAHADRFLELARELGQQIVSGDLRSALDAVELDHDNYRAAIDRSAERDRPDIGLEIGAGLWRFWQQRGHLVEGRSRLESLLAHPASGDYPVACGHGLLALGGVRFWLNDLEGAHEAYVEAESLLRSAGDRHGLANTLLDMAWTHSARGEVEPARAGLGEALLIFEELEDADLAHRARTALVNAHIRSGEWEAARLAHEPLLEEARATGRSNIIANRLAVATVISIHVGNRSSARATFNEIKGLDFHRSTSGYGGGFEISSLLAIAEGKPEMAARWLGTLQRLRDDGGAVVEVADYLGFDSAEVGARRALGDDFERHFEAGRMLTAEAAWLEVLSF